MNPGGATLPVQDGEGSVTNLAIDTINTARLRGTVAAQNGLTVAVVVGFDLLLLVMNVKSLY
ncbi:MAG: hypothetical protein ACRBB4_05785 [Neptuniibacter sp.]